MSRLHNCVSACCDRPVRVLEARGEKVWKSLCLCSCQILRLRCGNFCPNASLWHVSMWGWASYLARLHWANELIARTAVNGVDLITLTHADGRLSAATVPYHISPLTASGAGPTPGSRLCIPDLEPERDHNDMEWFVLVVERQRPLSFLSLSVSSQVDDLNHEWKGAPVKASQVSVVHTRWGETTPYRTEPYPTIPYRTLPSPTVYMIIYNTIRASLLLLPEIHLLFLGNSRKQTQTNKKHTTTRTNSLWSNLSFWFHRNVQNTCVSL